MKQKQPKPVKAWAMVEGGVIDWRRMSFGSSGATGMIRVEIRPVPVKPRKARRSKKK